MKHDGRAARDPIFDAVIAALECDLIETADTRLRTLSILSETRIAP